MLRFLFRALVVVGLALASLRVIGAFGEAIPQPIPAVARLQLAGEQRDLDVLFLGSSQTYASIDAAWLTNRGLRSFNLGAPTAGPRFYKLIYDNQVKTAGAPKRLVLDVSARTYSSSMSDNFHKYPIHRYLAEPLDDEEVALLERDLALYPARLVQSAQRAFARGVDFAWRRAEVLAEMERQRAELLGSRGYEPSPGTLKQMPAAPLLRSTFSDEKAALLRAFIEQVRGEGVGVELIVQPALRPMTSRADRRRLREELRAIEHLGVVVHRPDFVVPRDGWADTSHMNARGGAIFTPWVFKILTDTPTLLHEDP